MTNVFGFEIGTRYWIRYRSGTQRRDRSAIMTYLGKGVDGEYLFDARPQAGTQRMPVSWILEASERDERHPHYLGKMI